LTGQKEIGNALKQAGQVQATDVKLRFTKSYILDLIFFEIPFLNNIL
jgi:hypothetical protein